VFSIFLSVGATFSADFIEKSNAQKTDNPTALM
jgi:hypothetical protein